MLLIRPLAEEFHRESRYGHIPFSERKFKRHFLQTLNNPDDTLGAYVRHGDKVVGPLQAGVGDYYLGEGGRMVTVLTPRAVRDTMLGGRVTLKMLRIVTDWAKAQGALELHMHSTSGIAPQRTDRMLRRLGFKGLWRKLRHGDWIMSLCNHRSTSRPRRWLALGARNQKGWIECTATAIPGSIRSAPTSCCAGWGSAPMAETTR